MAVVGIVKKETYNDGVLIGTEEEVVSKKVGKEKPYFKMFIDDIAAIHKTTHGAKKVLFELLRSYVNRRGEIAIGIHQKREMAKSIGFAHTKSVDNGVGDLISKGVLLRISRGTFILNPSFFATGTASEVYEKQVKFCELRIIYNEKGREQKYLVSSTDSNGQ